MSIASSLKTTLTTALAAATLSSCAAPGGRESTNGNELSTNNHVYLNKISGGLRTRESKFIRHESFLSSSVNDQNDLLSMLRYFSANQLVVKSLIDSFCGTANRTSGPIWLEKDKDGVSLVSKLLTLLKEPKNSQKIDNEKFVIDLICFMGDVHSAINVDGCCGPVAILGTLAEAQPHVFYQLAIGVTKERKFTCKNGLTLQLPDDYTFQNNEEHQNPLANAVAKTLIDYSEKSYPDRSTSGGMRGRAILDVLTGLFDRRFVITIQLNGARIRNVLAEDATSDLPAIFVAVEDHIFGIADNSPTSDKQLISIGFPNESESGADNPIDPFKDRTHFICGINHVDSNGEFYILPEDQLARFKSYPFKANEIASYLNANCKILLPLGATVLSIGGMSMIFILRRGFKTGR